MAKAKATVEYRDVPGFPGYRVGSDGSVWSCVSKGPGTHLTDRWRKLRPSRQRSGDVVTLFPGPAYRKVHRLVLEAFVGPCPTGMEACHEDGNVRDSSAGNLRWGTPLSNMADRDRHGRTIRGERHRLAKLNAATVRLIRGSYAHGTDKSAIAARYGITRQNVTSIVSRRTWKHVA